MLPTLSSTRRYRRPILRYVALVGRENLCWHKLLRGRVHADLIWAKLRAC
jgi:hypothetical protein